MDPTKHNADPALRIRGRGTTLNAPARYERLDRIFESDGWDTPCDSVPLRTQVTTERPRSIITYNRSPDLPFDRSINPYRGCEHGCIYCFARPTHAYLGLSPGLDFETRLVARPDAAEVLEQELRHKGYHPKMIAIGTNTDAYQPIEQEYQIMRRCLQVLHRFHHPVGIVTKGALIERDIDILGDMASRGLARVGVSLTTLDAGLSRRLEPRAPGPARRLQMIDRLSAAGIPVRVMISPVIPGLTDHEIEGLMSAAKDAGAGAYSWIMLRLPQEVSPLFRTWLSTHYPDRESRVMGLIHDMRGGRDYDARFGRRMRGTGAHAQMVAQRFKVAARKVGLVLDLPSLRTDLFIRPVKSGDQLSLF